MCTAKDIKGKLHNSINDLIDGFKKELGKAQAQERTEINELDPTQRLTVEAVVEWAKKTRGMEKGIPAQKKSGFLQSCANLRSATPATGPAAGNSRYW